MSRDHRTLYRDAKVVPRTRLVVEDSSSSSSDDELIRNPATTVMAPPPPRPRKPALTPAQAVAVTVHQAQRAVGDTATQSDELLVQALAGQPTVPSDTDLALVVEEPSTGGGGGGLVKLHRTLSSLMHWAPARARWSLPPTGSDEGIAVTDGSAGRPPRTFFLVPKGRDGADGPLVLGKPPLSITAFDDRGRVAYVPIPVRNGGYALVRATSATIRDRWLDGCLPAAAAAPRPRTPGIQSISSSVDDDAMDLDTDTQGPRKDRPFRFDATLPKCIEEEFAAVVDNIEVLTERQRKVYAALQTLQGHVLSKRQGQ